MKFLITRASDPFHCGIKDFKTIEELIEFKKTVRQEIIITDNYYYQTDYDTSEFKGVKDTNEIHKIPYELEIYDDYRE